MMDVTAVVLSKRGYNRRYAQIPVLVHYSVINSSMDLCKARFDAVKSIGTKYFFYLDDDDDLPDQYPLIVRDCMSADVAVAYTDELVKTGYGTYIRRSSDYTQAKHLSDRSLIHHLAVCNTQMALEAIAKLPVGHYAPEMILYWELAKVSSKYVPGVGYIHNQSPGGMRTWSETAESWANSEAYCIKDHV